MGRTSTWSRKRTSFAGLDKEGEEEGDAASGCLRFVDIGSDCVSWNLRSRRAENIELMSSSSPPSSCSRSRTGVSSIPADSSMSMS